MAKSFKHPEAFILQAGYRRDDLTNAVAVRIYQTTSYQFETAGYAAAASGVKSLAA
jgi:O-acetylhomoserine (thiol)-lyase